MKKRLLTFVCAGFLFCASAVFPGCGDLDDLSFLSESESVPVSAESAAEASGFSSAPEESAVPESTEVLPSDDSAEMPEPSAPAEEAHSYTVSPDSDYIVIDEYGSQYVHIPEETFVINYNGDPEETFYAMAEALARREPTICIKDQPDWYDNTDFYAMPYSTFWLEDCSGEGLAGQTPELDGEHTYHFYRLTYYADFSDEELAEMKGEIDAATEEILQLVPEDADDWTRARIVHDELCRLVTYDQSTTAPHCHDTYGALVNHLAVCTGYACAFSHVMAALGDYCPLSYSDQHAWNYVAVPSDQVYIDVTWDDTDMADADGDPYIDYSYFFLTRDQVESIDSHSIESLDPVSEDIDPMPYNYYAHEGYLLEYYDWGTLIDILYRQYESGKNLLTVQFASEEDYQLALSWKENDSADIQEIIGSIGYYGAYTYWYTDAVRTVSFGLYAPEE